MAEPVAPVENQVQSEPLSDLPAAQPYGQPRDAAAAVITHPEPHEPSPAPTPAPVFDSRRNRFIDPATNKIVRDPTKPPVEQPATISSNAQEPVEPVEQAQQPQAIQHTPLTLHLARSFNIPEHIIATTPPADLRAEISLIQQHQAMQSRNPAPAAPVEDAIDWGINPETKQPFKESDLDEYPMHKQMVKKNHQLEQKMLAQERELENIKRANADRSRQTVVQQFHSLCDKHPEIFGSADAPPGSPEAISRSMMENQLAALVNSRQQTTLEKDFQRMLIAFGRQPQAAPTDDPMPAALQGRMTKEQWERSAMAQTAHRNTAPLPKTRRQVIAERVDNEARRNGVKVVAGSASDLSDLPPR